jgi:hypothetical protein
MCDLEVCNGFLLRIAIFLVRIVNTLSTGDILIHGIHRSICKENATTQPGAVLIPPNASVFVHTGRRKFDRDSLESRADADAVEAEDCFRRVSRSPAEIAFWIAGSERGGAGNASLLTSPSFFAPDGARS